MAMIRFKCTCGKALSVDGKYAGRVAKCPGCGAALRVPTPESTPKSTPEPAPDNLAKELSSLSSAYGQAIKARSQNKRTAAMLTELQKQRRRRRLIAAACGVGLLLLFLVIRSLVISYGPNWDAGDHPAEALPFLRGLNASEPPTRAAARWELADLGDRNIARLLGELDNDPEPLVRLVSLWALSRIGDPVIADELTPLLQDPDLDVRMTAVMAICRCRAESQTPASFGPLVAQALEQEDVWRLWFDEVAAGRKTTLEITTDLDARWRTGSVAARRQIAWMNVLSLEPDLAVQRVRAMLSDPAPEVVISAIHALHPLVTKEAFERIPNTDARARREQRTLRLQALNGIALKLLQHKRGTRATTYIETHDGIKTAAALALARNGQPETVVLFERPLGDADWFIRFAGLKGLEMLPPNPALDLIRSVQDYDPSKDGPWVRRVAERIEAAADPSPQQEPVTQNE